MPHGQGHLTKSCFNFETKRAASDEKSFSNAEFHPATGISGVIRRYTPRVT
jgi:hypothetical protein